MKIKELKRLIENVPDEADVGVLDHFGEFMEVDALDFEYHPANSRWRHKKEAFFTIPAVDIGEHPD